jgi:hypothetical protein
LSLFLAAPTIERTCWVRVVERIVSFKHVVLLVSLVLLMVACGGPKLSSLQASCAERYPDFPGEMRCLKQEALAADPQLSRPGGDLVRVYLAMAMRRRPVSPTAAWRR